MTTPLRPLTHPRVEIVDTIERIYRYKMTTTSGGNLSIKDENGAIWITPARVDKGNLTPRDIVCVHADGRIEGPHPPSSEFPFHEQIYEVRADIKAVVHAHSVALVAFSISGGVPDTRVFPQASHVCGGVGFAPYELPGSAALGCSIARSFAQGHHCVMLENHGVAIGGSNLQDAFERFETLEFCAKTLIKAGILAPKSLKILGPEQIALAERPRPTLPEMQPEPATTREKHLRHELCEFIQRGYRQRLLTSTEGSFSARLDDDAFVISCYKVDRRSVSPYDLATVRAGRREPGKFPSRAALLHRAIYRKHPGVHAIVNATPVNATAFAISDTPLDARTIPESYIFLRDVKVIPFEDHYTDVERVADRVSATSPAALMENNGVLILGKSVLDAFDRLEVLESTAEAIINSRPLGPVSPIPQPRIDELVMAFLTPKPG